MTTRARALAAAGLAAATLHATATWGSPTPSEPTWTWAAFTSSPGHVARAAMSDRETELELACGVGEEGLRRVAQRAVDRKLAGQPYLDVDGLTFALRTAGEPHVWPHAWTISGLALDQSTVLARIAAWRRTFHDPGERRCGVAIGYGRDGTEVVAAVALDALADLSALPTRARTGTWLTVDATIHVPATFARVVLLGPSGEPRGIPTAFDGGRVHARFATDRPGAFTVQVLAEVETGPRPVLEAHLFADVEPPSTLPTSAAPGEAASHSARDEKDALATMIQATRTEMRLSALVPDGRLDTLAAAHARRMMSAGTLGHDVGDGDPSERLRDAGIMARVAGENVAHAPSVKLAHRTLYASPSHRANLVSGEYNRLGLAVIDDPDGSVWVTELFASVSK